MAKHVLTNGTRQLVVTILLVTALAGCSQTKSWMSGSRSSPSDEQIILGAPDANEYLNELYLLTSGDPATQAEIYADSRSAATLTPDPFTSLRYALVLATPGHAESDPTEAASLLRELLSRTELLTQVEISLATIHLETAQELIVLSTETRQLRASTSRATQTEEAASNQRLATVESENRRLRRELQEAEDKLDAISSIERSIRDQE
jgi:hypothetical protein